MNGHKLISRLAAVAGIALYSWQAWGYMHRLPAMLDEGAYLFKGLLFVTGRYAPFEPYGPWTNKMPYLFYFWGWVQKIFGPGLRTGRYVAFGLSLLILMLVWAVAQRWSGDWVAAGAIWLFALSPMTIAIYAYAISEVVIAAVLTLALFVLVRRDFSRKQAFSGGFWLAVLALLRIHMILIAPFLLLYIWFQHGKRRFYEAGGTFLLTVSLGYAAFWPEILRLWQMWMPTVVKETFPDVFVQIEGVQTLTPSISPLLRWQSVALSIYSEGALLFGLALIAIYGLRKDVDLARRYWIGTGLLLYGVMYGLFAWGSVGHTYCVDCLRVYQRFITPLGVILLAVAVPVLAYRWILWYQLVVSTLFFGWAGFFGLALFERYGYLALNWPVPRIRGKRFVGGWTTLWGWLDGKFHLEYETARIVAPILLAILFAGVFLVVLVWGISWRNKTGTRTASQVSLGILLVFAVVSFVTYQDWRACSSEYDALRVNETVGRYLRDALPQGSLIYWDGGESIVPLLYVPGIEIFPPQINGRYAFVYGGNTEQVQFYGHYNDDLDNLWRARADYIVISRAVRADWKQYLQTEHFQEVDFPAIALACHEKTSLLLFKRIH